MLFIHHSKLYVEMLFGACINTYEMTMTIAEQNRQRTTNPPGRLILREDTRISILNHFEFLGIESWRCLASALCARYSRRK